MSIINEIRSTIGEGRAALTDPKPLHAVAGAGDLLVERVRTTAAARQRALQSFRLHPSAVPARVIGTVGRVNQTYEGLAQRGATLVGRIRRQPASRDLADQVQNTVRAVKTTTTTARNASAATTSRAKATATSARKATSAARAATAAAATKTGTTGAATNAPSTRTSPRTTSARPRRTTATKRAASAKKTSATATKRTASAKKTSTTAK